MDFSFSVVKGKGILCRDPHKLSPILSEIYDHFTHKVFYLELNESVRQRNDKKYYETLLRIRHANCSENDVTYLNERYKDELKQCIIDSANWKTAPILAGKRDIVDKVNLETVKKNSLLQGAFCIHSLPKFNGTEDVIAKRKKLEKYLTTTRSRENNANSFKPYPKLHVYRGMPVMLRQNICPSLGLSNGSIGNVLAVLSQNIPELEDNKRFIERACSEAIESNFIPSVLVHFENYYKGKIGAVKSDESRVKYDYARKVVLVEPQNFGNIRGIPLIPAHSMTIHKSQSLTIPYVKIDPTDPFACGQLYVAFSRAPSHDRIILLKKVSLESLNKFRKEAQRIEEKLQDMKLNSSSFDSFCKYIADEIDKLDEELFNKEKHSSKFQKQADSEKRQSIAIKIACNTQTKTANEEKVKKFEITQNSNSLEKVFRYGSACRIIQSLTSRNDNDNTQTFNLQNLTSFKSEENRWKIIDVPGDGNCWIYSSILSLWYASNSTRETMNLNVHYYRKKMSTLLLQMNKLSETEKCYWKNQLLVSRERVAAFETFRTALGFDSLFSAISSAIENDKAGSCTWAGDFGEELRLLATILNTTIIIFEKSVANSSNLSDESYLTSCGFLLKKTSYYEPYNKFCEPSARLQFNVSIVHVNGNHFQALAPPAKFDVRQVSSGFG